MKWEAPNNLSILPDLDSNRISIRHRSYLATFSVVWAVLCQILCLIFLELEINLLRQWRIFYFRSIADAFATRI